jgi:hypothetical protein
MKELEFRNIINHKNYIVYSNGEVASFRKRNSNELYETPNFLKQQILTTDRKVKYKRVKLDGKWYYTHRLVAIHFIENSNNKPQVNHIDGDGLNNNVENLEWVTNSENQIHRFNLNGSKNKLARYVHKNRGAYRVCKKGVVDKGFKILEEAEEYAKQYY